MVPQICNLGVIICFIMISTDDISFPLVYLVLHHLSIKKRQIISYYLFFFLAYLSIWNTFAAMAVSAGPDHDSREAYDLFFCQFVYLIPFQLILMNSLNFLVSMNLQDNFSGGLMMIATFHPLYVFFVITLLRRTVLLYHTFVMYQK